MGLLNPRYSAGVMRMSGARLCFLLFAIAMAVWSSPPSAVLSAPRSAATEISLKPIGGGTEEELRRTGALTAEPQLALLPPEVLKVVEAQVGLIRDGISPGPIDGLMGAQTEAALRAFQE